MAGQFPTSIGAQALRISSFSPTRISVTHSLKRQARSIGAQRFRLSVTLPPLRRVNKGIVAAFLLSQRGQFDTFTYIPPIEGYTAGSNTGVTRVDSAFAIGTNTVTHNGNNAPLAVGDYFRFLNHSKIYMATAVSLGSTTFEPPLMQDLTENVRIFYDDVPFTVALESDLTEIDVDTSLLYGLNLEMVEVY